MHRAVRPLQQPLEFIVAESGIADDVSHRDRVYWIMPGNGKYSGSICHDDVLTLSRYPKTSLLQCPNCLEVVHTR